MAAIGFWNVDARRNLETDQRLLPRFAAEFARERSLDLLFLIECAIPAELLLAEFTYENRYAQVSSGERFKVLARFDPELMRRLPLLVPNDRFDIWQLALPLQEEVLIGVVHGLDRRNNSLQKQELFLQQFATALAHCERNFGHSRSVVLGDFNSNPFESPIASALGMNAVISRAIAQGEPRYIYQEMYPYFYNPMWNIHGDDHGHAPATYYYRGGDPHELYWHMLDQVLIRPSLVERFDSGSLEIVTSIGDAKLITQSGFPDRRRFSDHLPVVFSLDLSALRGGASHGQRPLARF